MEVLLQMSVLRAVFLYVEPCKKAETDGDAVWGRGQSYVGCGLKEPYVSCGVHIGTTWHIRLNYPCSTAL